MPSLQNKEMEAAQTEWSCWYVFVQHFRCSKNIHQNHVNQGVVGCTPIQRGPPMGNPIYKPQKSGKSQPPYIQPFRNSTIKTPRHWMFLASAHGPSAPRFHPRSTFQGWTGCENKTCCFNHRWISRNLRILSTWRSRRYICISFMLGNNKKWLKKRSSLP